MRDEFAAHETHVWPVVRDGAETETILRRSKFHHRYSQEARRIRKDPGSSSVQYSVMVVVEKKERGHDCGRR